MCLVRVEQTSPSYRSDHTVFGSLDEAERYLEGEDFNGGEFGDEWVFVKHADGIKARATIRAM